MHPITYANPPVEQAVAKTTLLNADIASLTRPGERYAGLVLDNEGNLSHHLFLLAGDFKGDWNAAVAWAKEVGGELPTRGEQAVLFGNARGEFKKDWYWSGEQHAANADYAWYQDFLSGYQDDYDKSASLRARAVRRLPI